MRSSKPGGRLLRPGRIHGAARARCDHEDGHPRREMSALLLGEEAAVGDAAPLVALEERLRLLRLEPLRERAVLGAEQPQRLDRLVLVDVEVHLDGVDNPLFHNAVEGLRQAARQEAGGEESG